MAPGLVDFPSWRFLAGAAIPLWLAMAATPDRLPDPARRSAVPSPTKAADRVPARAQTPARAGYREGDDLRAYVERAMAHLDDPRTMYYVSQALEECHAWGRLDEDDTDASVTVVSHVDLKQWKRSWASAELAAPCRGFDGLTIDSRDILALLQEAARHGEPHARARMLSFRDIAAPKLDVMAEIPGLLATGDPQVIRDVGAFLTRGEESLGYGGEEVDAPSAAIAWELAACDMGFPCGPMSRLVLASCAFRGHCDEYRYDAAVARDEDPSRMALAQRLRVELVRALRRQDWGWLGLDRNG
ncbi:MAG TPA: hypothetical protein VFD95_12540 [Usitatibacter sp.]|nr:hypothetical protein [Usitatibacter sp.]